VPPDAQPPQLWHWLPRSVFGWIGLALSVAVAVFVLWLATLPSTSTYDAAHFRAKQHDNFPDDAAIITTYEAAEGTVNALMPVVSLAFLTAIVANILALWISKDRSVLAVFQLIAVVLLILYGISAVGNSHEI
jgi:hypothetical protein